MKTLLTILSIILCLNLHATTYYVSVADGNDGNSGTSTSSPWKTLIKVNSFSGNLNPGDQVLFKRGETFFGKLAPPTSGTGDNTGTVFIGAYGSGNKPILTALQTLSFSGGSGNIYTSSTFNPESNPDFLMINGVMQQIGRWPNASAANNGYFKVTSATADKTANTTSVTDANWTSHGSPINDWTGAQLAYRQNRFTFITPVILDQTFSGSSTTFKFPWVQSPGKYGYFIQNHVKCLDQQGEWCYNTNKTTSIYLTSGPSGLNIQMPVYDNIIYLSGINYWTIDNIRFLGANGYGVSTNGGSRITIQNCEFITCSHAGVITKSTANALVQNNFVDGCLKFGIQAKNGSCTMLDNVVQNTTPILGMGGGGNTAGSGFDITGSNHTARYNTVINSGYAGFEFHDGSNVLIENNIIDGYCMKTDDGGAFYTVNQVKNFTYTNKIIRRNIIKHGENAASSLVGTFETGVETYPLYADQWTNNITWDGNTAIGGYTGYFANDPINNTITNNLFYNIRANNVQFRNNHTDYDIKGNVITNNVFFSTAYNGSLGMLMTKVTSGTISGYGTFNNNYYVRPYNSSQPFKATISGTSMSYYLPAWHTTYGFETTGQLSPKTFTSSQDPISYTMLLVNETKSPQTTALTGSWVSARNVSYTTSITLQPFTSEVLLFGSGGNPPPPPNPNPGAIKAKTKYKVIDKILP